MTTPYQLPSSFSWGIQGALESVKRWELPQSINSPVINPQGVKQTSIPKKKKEWKVQIDDGSTIVFDSEPTQQDIEEAYAQVQNYKKPQPESPQRWIWEQIAWFGQWLVLWTARLPWNIAWALGKWLWSIAGIWWENVLSKSLRQTWQEMQSRLNSPANYIAWINKDLTGIAWESVWEFTSGLMTTGALTPKIPLKPWFLKWATTGALETGIFSAWTQWEVNPSDLLVWWALGGILWKIPTAKNLKASAKEWVRKQAEEIALPTIKELGKRDRWQLTKDVVETWKWLFKKPEIVRDAKEALAIEETARLIWEWKLKKWMTELKKLSVVDDEIENLATTLTSRLRQSDTSLSKQQMLSLFDDISNKTLENPAIVWDSETALKKILPQLRKNLNKSKYYPDDILLIRKEFDNAIRWAKWEWVFDPKLESAFTTALRDFRQWLNNKVWELVPDAQVRQLLDKQSALYTVQKTLADRWSGQSGTFVWRALNKIQWITGVPRTEIVELFTALGLSSAWVPLVWPLAWVVTAWALTVKWAKKLASPKNKILVSNIISKFDELAKNNPNKDVLNARSAFINFINNIREND